jgi:hypothetical protein
MANVFTGEGFIRALEEGALKEPLIRIGMVKKQDDSTDGFLFAERGCGEWIYVPIMLVEQVTFLRTVPCRDHQHPLVMIQFRAPAADDRAATLFAQLARSGAAMAPIAGGKMPHGMPGVQPSSQPAGGPPQFSHARSWGRGGGGGFGGLGGNLTCIVWHEECRWVQLYIPSLGINIPWYVCELICDIYEP